MSEHYSDIATSMLSMSSLNPYDKDSLSLSWGAATGAGVPDLALTGVSSANNTHTYDVVKGLFG